MTAGVLLGQARPANTTIVSVYAPKRNVLTEITSIVICNTTAATASSFRICLDADGTTYDETTALFWDEALAASVARLLGELGWFMMGAQSGNLAVRSANASALTFSVFGIERQI